MSAAACNRSISDMVNEAVRLTLAKDVEDLRDVERRQAEPSTDFADFLANTRESGRV
jgi:hypothetical protein